MHQGRLRPANSPYLVMRHVFFHSLHPVVLIACHISCNCCITQVPSSTRDVSGLLQAWPALQSLQLSQLTPAAVADTCWDMRQLTALTSLCLQVAPSTAAVAAVAASGGSASPTFLQDVTVTLKLEQMPEGLQQLQLTGCTLQVPYYVPFR